MSTIYVACKYKAGVSDIIAAFEREGDAERSAKSHEDEGVKTWVEEVKYYKGEE